MGFLNAMKNEILEDFNESTTENGAVGYRTSGKSLLDLNFAASSLRSASEEEIIERFKAAFFEDMVLAIKWLFFARDIRGGLGERRLFRTAMKFVAEHDAEIVKKLIPLIPEYGRFDDLWEFLPNARLKTAVVEYVKSRIGLDLINVSYGNSISLLGKWLPSANASSKQTKKHAKILMKSLGLEEKDYRKMLTALRKHIDVVETKMSAKRWDEINYEAVPSRANLIYSDAFLRNDKARREDFLSKLESGEAKINASTLFPHDIIHKYASDYHKLDPTVEALWKALPNTVNESSNTIVVADGSGSMCTTCGTGSVTALEVANALAIYFAEHSSGEFKDKYITFSKRPQLVDFVNATSLRDKLSIARRYDEVANTNIEAVFDLILNTAQNNNLPQSDIPANVLIISDMEFDACVTGNFGRVTDKLFKVIEKRYEDAGYKLPRLVFWNVNSRTNTIPVRENDMGVALVSGFSVNVCKMVMSGKTDPFECLLEQLNDERYDAITEALIS